MPTPTPCASSPGSPAWPIGQLARLVCLCATAQPAWLVWDPAKPVCLLPSNFDPTEARRNRPSRFSLTQTLFDRDLDEIFNKKLGDYDLELFSIGIRSPPLYIREDHGRLKDLTLNCQKTHLQTLLSSPLSTLLFVMCPGEI